MLFSSYFFLLIFLPLSLSLYFLCSRLSPFLGLLSIVITSSIFYAWHKPLYLALMFASILLNYIAAKLILRSHRKSLILVFALIFNVGMLAFFKYLNFFLENINFVFSSHFTPFSYSLPLAISFFTFQQIGFLVDIYKRGENIPSFLEYSSFITFFPQLIAGPIVKHSDYLPQIQNSKTFSLSYRNLSIGSTLFVVGLFKKTMLADKAGVLADAVYSLASEGIYPTLLEAWIGILSYSFQIYFDFSGYSDMAIGLARIFNIHLPLNFYSPYKSTSFIEFWRRWHISLSTFLKEHIYIPLGGNKKGIYLRYQNLMVTMLIGGLWHGASWTFVIWGGLHGTYLVLNHLLRQIWKQSALFSSRALQFFKTTFVFLVVTLTWVFFRASNLKEVKILFSSLFNFENLVLPANYIKLAAKFGVALEAYSGKLYLSHDIRGSVLFILFTLTLITFFTPNVYEWMGYFSPSKGFLKPPHLRRTFFKTICWKPTVIFGIIIFMLLILSFGNMNAPNEFIYFQF